MVGLHKTSWLRMSAWASGNWDQIISQNTFKLHTESQETMSLPHSGSDGNNTNALKFWSVASYKRRREHDQHQNSIYINSTDQSSLLEPHRTCVFLKKHQLQRWFKPILLYNELQHQPIIKLRHQPGFTLLTCIIMKTSIHVATIATSH